ncbi:hypothetical protein [Rubripirellula reticaptiva]|uniref:Uncharacterized protein n=1 Tax=Rubripirellula reticaptiva TaxID=2528013 RepID=A0A5C6FB77_9BACT|nr:hypothetical protein [Rubripirellula reticaptiva]TWU57787.1 hypothetical protein Poly59_06960 [Rubripirellula reticaptiva]
MRRFSFLVIFSLALIELVIAFFSSREPVSPLEYSPKTTSADENADESSNTDPPAEWGQFDVAKIRGPLEPSIRSSLDSFHRQTSQKFANAPGFGRSRGGAHVLMDSGAVKFVTDSIVEKDPESANNKVGDGDTGPYGLWGSLGTKRDSFLSPNQSPGPTQKARPQTRKNTPHTFGFRFLTPEIVDASDRWTLDEIQLLSIHNDRVYLIDDKIQRMQELSDNTPFRSLDSFEQDAVGVLRYSGEDEIVVQDQGDQIRMVGAIRIKAQCQACHSESDVGDVFGAFTYRFSNRDESELAGLGYLNTTRIQSDGFGMVGVDD